TKAGACLGAMATVAKVAALVGGLFVGNITDRARVGRSSPRRLSHFGGLGISVHNARWRVPSPRRGVARSATEAERQRPAFRMADTGLAGVSSGAGRS